MLGRTGRWEATMGEDSNVGLRLDRREARLLLSIPSSSFWLQHLDCPSRNCPDPLHSLGGIISSSAMAKGYVRLSNPHWAIPAFSSRNLNLEYGNRGCNIYPFGGSLKGLPINSAYRLLGYPYSSTFWACQVRFCKFCELSHIIPMRSFKGRFLLLATQELWTKKKFLEDVGYETCLNSWEGWVAYSRWGGRYPQSLWRTFLSLAQEETSRKCEKSDGRCGARVGKSSPACLEGAGPVSYSRGFRCVGHLSGPQWELQMELNQATPERDEGRMGQGSELC